jgi:hypothetical protein
VLFWSKSVDASSCRRRSGWPPVPCGESALEHSKTKRIVLGSPLLLLLPALFAGCVANPNTGNHEPSPAAVTLSQGATVHQRRSHETADIESLQRDIDAVMQALQANRDGKLYTGAAEGVDPDDLAIAVALIDGRSLVAGDTDVRFPLMSVSKLLLGQMDRGLRPTDMIDVVHHVVSRQNNLGFQIAEGHLQNCAARLETDLRTDMRGQRRGGEKETRRHSAAISCRLSATTHSVPVVCSAHFSRKDAARCTSVSNTSNFFGTPNTARRKRNTSRFISPHPTRPMASWADLETRCVAANAALAAVRWALIFDPSSRTCGLPVSTELRTMTADARSIPRSTFSGKEAIHFMPATGSKPPSKAGNAMIRSRGLSGKRRKVEWGRLLRPREWSM